MRTEKSEAEPIRSWATAIELDISHRDLRAYSIDHIGAAIALANYTLAITWPEPTTAEDCQPNHGRVVMAARGQLGALDVPTLDAKLERVKALLGPAIFPGTLKELCSWYTLPHIESAIKVAKSRKRTATAGAGVLIAAIDQNDGDYNPRRLVANNVATFWREREAAKTREAKLALVRAEMSAADATRSAQITLAERIERLTGSQRAELLAHIAAATNQRLGQLGALRPGAIARHYSNVVNLPEILAALESGARRIVPTSPTSKEA